MSASLRLPARLAAGAALVALVLMAPNHPAALTPEVLLVFPLELPAILALLALAPPGRGARLARAAIVAVLGLSALLKLADFAMNAALDRPFEPALDLHLAEAGWRLAAGAVGALPAAAALAGAAALLALLVLGLWRATRPWAALRPAPAARRFWTAAALVAALLATADVGQALGWWRAPVEPPGIAFTARVAWERATGWRRTLAELRAFEAAAREDPFHARPPDLAGLGGRDVLIVFVESYGRSSLEVPLYAPTHRTTLEAAEARLGAAGLAMRSGWLTAPTYGGRSWLSHATLATGLRIGDQSRYAAALASPRRSLFDLARQTGYRTAAVMPAITLDWPESALMGFDEVHAAKDLGYAGRPFNWVTMPDQFTLAALDRLLRPGGPGAPLFAQVALISSHAPWTPIPPVIPWERIGDGRVFDDWADSGDPPEVVWRDRDRVRAQYRKAVDYALRVVAEYALRHAGDPPLLVVLGDHQPAGFVAMSDSRDTPIHLIGPPELVAAAEGWGWTEGLIPAADAPVWPMEAFRDRFLAAFARPGAES